ncbi:MAG: hypothetical protein SFU86_07810 [Pirellulaceae bacterium]|nr:hypothetical protein [Pirellulaceae bacterium]
MVAVHQPPPPPKQIKPPSERDRQIHYCCHVRGLTQKVVAKMFKLSQPRIHQILKKNASYFADADPAELGQLAPEQERRLAHWEGKLRTEATTHWVMRRLAEAEQPQVTTRVRKDSKGNILWEETTTRDRLASAALGRLALNASEKLKEYADTAPPPAKKPEEQPEPLKRGLYWLKRVEDGIYTVDLADQSAAMDYELCGTVPRLWDKYDDRPPVVLPAGMQLRAIFGRFGVDINGNYFRLPEGETTNTADNKNGNKQEASNKLASAGISREKEALPAENGARVNYKNQAEHQADANEEQYEVDRLPEDAVEYFKEQGTYDETEHGPRYYLLTKHGPRNKWRDEGVEIVRKLDLPADLLARAEIGDYEVESLSEDVLAYLKRDGQYKEAEHAPRYFLRAQPERSKRLAEKLAAKQAEKSGEKPAAVQGAKPGEKSEAKSGAKSEGMMPKHNLQQPSATPQPILPKSQRPKTILHGGMPPVPPAHVECTPAAFAKYWAGQD